MCLREVFSLPFPATSPARAVASLAVSFYKNRTYIYECLLSRRYPTGMEVS